MFKNKEAATRMNEAMRKILDAMQEAVDLTISNPSFSKKDRKLVCIGIGHSMGRDIHDILMELYVAHPDLIPDGFLLPGEEREKWAKDYKKVLRREKKRRR
jgi:hypothetical protein